MQPPETHFARCDDSQIAYQVFGAGSVELVVAGGPAGHVELYWEEPLAREFYERLGAFARVATFDRHGTGASDPTEEFSDERWIDDIEAVIEACGFKRPALLGALEAARTCALYAANHPQQIAALVLIDMAARGRDVLVADQVEWLNAMIEGRWGTGELTSIYAPSMVDNDRFRRWMARMERLTVPPRGARELLRQSVASDVSECLPRIKCPTLLLHHRENAMVPLQLGRDAADAIPGARLVEVAGQDSMAWLGDSEGVLGEVEEFLTGARGASAGSRRLRAILFTDIVGSTQLAARLGDGRWGKLLAEHDQCVKHEIEKAGGSFIKNIGDGSLSVFDTPDAALAAAQSALRSTGFLNITLRAGIHVGTVDEVGEDVRGIAVHVAARCCKLAGGGQVLVSSTAKDTLLDEEIELKVVSTTELRGVPGQWGLFALDDDAGDLHLAHAPAPAA